MYTEGMLMVLGWRGVMPTWRTAITLASTMFQLL